MSQNSTEGTVLVAGASGYVGGKLVPELLQRGIKVRALTRNPHGLRELSARGVEVVQGDVMDRRSLRSALDGVESAYYLVHSMGKSTGEHTFADSDRYAAQNFAAEGGHLTQILYLGGLGDPADDLSPHLRSRHEVAEILSAGRAPTTVLRAGIIIGGGSASFIMLRSLVSRLPVMVCPRWVDTRAQPIGIQDVLSYLGSALGKRAALHQAFEIGGPEVMSYHTMMNRMGDILGKRHLTFKVPVLTPKLSAYWVDLVTPVPASVAHALIEGLRNEVVVRDNAAQQVFGLTPTPFDDAVREALAG